MHGLGWRAASPAANSSQQTVVNLQGEVKLSSRASARILEGSEHLAAKFVVTLPPAPKVIDHEDDAA